MSSALLFREAPFVLIVLALSIFDLVETHSCFSCQTPDPITTVFPDFQYVTLTLLRPTIKMFTFGTFGHLVDSCFILNLYTVTISIAFSKEIHSFHKQKGKYTSG